MPKPRYVNRLEQILQLSEQERKTLKPVTDRYIFRSNEYYQSLIDWNDPNDPIRRIVIPDKFEELEWGELDASHEDTYMVARGCEHKYRDTALLLCNDVCGAYCRFCFRKRLFMDDNDDSSKDVSEGLAYIRNHPEINNVLLTGGDPLIMSNGRLERIISQVREIDHVHIIRIGTKMPAFNPFRVTEDPGLLEMLSKYSTDRKKIYIMAHFNHPRELTDEAVKSLNLLQKAGVATINQTPLIRGVNDDADILTQLFNTLSFIGVPPYYLFQCRPTAGNFSYATPIEESLKIFTKSRKNLSGLAKRARLSMSHRTGKIEILGMDDERIFFRFHRAADPANIESFISCRRNPNAYWMDDYEDFEFREESESLLPQVMAG